MNLRLLSLFVLLALAPFVRAHEDQLAGEMTVAAQHFLAVLTPEQKAKAQFQLTDEERKNWHFIPRVRKGLPIKEMNQGQRLLAQALLTTGLSPQGYGKALGIMSLEDVLAELEKGKGPIRDPENYFFSIFGEPDAKQPWGWRVEGHHLSLNFAAAGGDLAATPSFLGTNPGEVKEGPRAGTRFLASEEEFGRAFVKSLSEEERKRAIILAEAPKDVVNAPGRHDWTKPDGVQQKTLSPEQRAALVHLIHLYLDRHRSEIATDEWTKIEKAGLGNIYFAWAGGLEPGQPHYYRVQGPTFVLEYDNTQNNANHVHTLWRSTENDFGDDLLKRHYEQSHTAAAAAFTVEETPERITLRGSALEASIKKTGYVSGVESKSFLDKKTGARDLGFGLDIQDWIMEPGSDEAYRDQLPGDLPYQFNNKYHGATAKRSIEGPQICTKARELHPHIIQGKDFTAIEQSWNYTIAAPGKQTGSEWKQTLVFPAGQRYFISSDRILSRNDGEKLFFRQDMPGHIKHKGGDTFSEVYLSYRGKIPAKEFVEDFAPDEKFNYRRDRDGVPQRMIRAYHTRDPQTGADGPWLAGMTLNPSDTSEAWCHQRTGYVCLIQEVGERPVKAGESFGAAYIVGWFDSIEEMEKVYDQYRGNSALEVTTDGWKLVPSKP
ncbi:MAG TPA: DUF3500 domain-containing protein [Chthoniobacteraceae bacterium]|jgi:hypothetical protein|nr:DUF3500 domain-containing protein [Chthoniobacteraceae bacterium]